MRRKEKIILLSLIFLYGATRLFNLNILPVTTDEAIYLHWARIIGDDFGQKFLPLMDGKTPLFMWFAIPFLKLIPDPFIAGRVLSILFGFGTLMTLELLASALFGGKAWFWVGLLYLVTPFALMHDRLALVEGMLLFWEVLFLYFLVRLAQYPSAWFAIAVGGTFGLAFWTKPSALLFALFIPLSMLLVHRTQFRPWFTRIIIGIFVGGCIVFSLSLSPHFQTIFVRSKEYTYSFAEIFLRPGQIILGNGQSLVNWIVMNHTLAIIVGSLIGLIWMLQRHMRTGVFLLLCFLGLFSMLSATGKVLYPRYTFILTPFIILPFAFLLSRGFSRIRSVGLRVLVGVLLPIVMMQALQFDRALLLKPESAPWVDVDQWQYFSSWASGYGVKEAVELLADRAQIHPIVVGSEGRFGNPYDSLALAFWDNPNVRVVAADFTRTWPEVLDQIDGDAYYVVHKSRYPVLLPPDIERIMQFVKPSFGDEKEELWVLHKLPEETL